MKHCRVVAIGLVGLLTTFLLLVLLLPDHGATGFGRADSGVAEAQPAGTCGIVPSHFTWPAAETSWEIFAAINCRMLGTNHLAWENWPEQTVVYSTAPLTGRTPVRRFHTSLLERALTHRGVGRALVIDPSQDCAPMGGQNFIPAAVQQQMAAFTICEEVHLDPTAARFIRSHGYQHRSVQAAAADIEFPTSAVEVKADWIPATDFKTPPFSCTNPPADLYVESVVTNGTPVCYALVGMHINSKLLPDWVWATFEPQNALTNSMRCKLYGSCQDGWGARPPVSRGGTTVLTPAALALMNSPLVPRAFLNYRLDGAQTHFLLPTGQPSLLGSSIIEGENAGVAVGQASCITCHSSSLINGPVKTDAVSYFGATGIKLIGTACQPNQGWHKRDFVWSMLLASPAGPTPAPSVPCH
jgi:hypothetical protein